MAPNCHQVSFIKTFKQGARTVLKCLIPSPDIYQSTALRYRPQAYPQLSLQRSSHFCFNISINIKYAYGNYFLLQRCTVFAFSNMFLRNESVLLAGFIRHGYFGLFFWEGEDSLTRNKIQISAKLCKGLLLCLPTILTKTMKFKF